MQDPGFDDFLAHFKDQFSPETKDGISGSSTIKHLKEWSSLQTLIVVTAMDEKYGVILSEEDFRLSVTVQDLYTRLCMKL